jgi:hypothetical protein
VLLEQMHFFFKATKKEEVFGGAYGASHMPEQGYKHERRRWLFSLSVVDYAGLL